MTLSTFVLALWVFLISSTQLAWFVIDQKFIGAVGVFFVAIVVFEAFWLVWRGAPFMPVKHRAPAA